jgi:hypothetical protein
VGNPGVGGRIPGAEARIPEADVKAALLSSLAGEVLDPLQTRGAVGGGPTLASADSGATSKMRSAQRAAASKLPSNWLTRMA